MNRKEAVELIPFVNSLVNLELLQNHIERRIRELHFSLESISDLREIQLVQGRIAELRKLTKLRDEVLRDAK